MNITYIIAIPTVMLFLLFTYLLFKSLETKRWVSTEGKILSKEVDKGALKNNESHLYTANIKYSYNVNGKEFVSKRIFYGNWIAISTPFSAQETVKRYKKTNVTVYYNPNNPKESVLEQGINRLICRILLPFIIFAIVIYLLETGEIKI